MVARCRRHDPIVFGHDWFCELGLGPARAPEHWARRSDFRPERQCVPAVIDPEPEPKKWRTKLAQQTRDLLVAYSRMKYAESGIKPPD